MSPLSECLQIVPFIALIQFWCLVRQSLCPQETFQNEMLCFIPRGRRLMLKLQEIIGKIGKEKHALYSYWHPVFLTTLFYYIHHLCASLNTYWHIHMALLRGCNVYWSSLYRFTSLQCEFGTVTLWCSGVLKQLEDSCCSFTLSTLHLLAVITQSNLSTKTWCPHFYIQYDLHSEDSLISGVHYK